MNLSDGKMKQTAEMMESLLKATSRSDLANQLGQPQPFLPSSAKPEELRQLSDFLKACVSRTVLDYPLSILRDSDVGGLPDFTFVMPSRAVGVELTTVSANQLEKSRVDQSKAGVDEPQLGARAVASLKVDDRKRTLAQRRSETLIPTPEVLLLPWLQVEDAWLSNVLGKIGDKTKKMARPQYRLGDEGWLLLDDRISTSEAELKSRLPNLRDALEIYWRNYARAFQRVFLQPRERRALFMLSSDACGEGV